MPNQYPHFRGGSERCTQATPLVKARNGKQIKMLNLKFVLISDPAANTMQTAVPCKVVSKCLFCFRQTVRSEDGGGRGEL